MLDRLLHPPSCSTSAATVPPRRPPRPVHYTPNKPRVATTAGIRRAHLGKFGEREHRLTAATFNAVSNDRRHVSATAPRTPRIMSATTSTRDRSQRSFSQPTGWASMTSTVAGSGSPHSTCETRPLKFLVLDPIIPRSADGRFLAQRCLSGPAASGTGGDAGSCEFSPDGCGMDVEDGGDGGEGVTCLVPLCCLVDVVSGHFVSGFTWRDAELLEVGGNGVPVYADGFGDAPQRLPGLIISGDRVDVAWVEAALCTGRGAGFESRPASSETIVVATVVAGRGSCGRRSEPASASCALSSTRCFRCLGGFESRPIRSTGVVEMTTKSSCRPWSEARFERGAEGSGSSMMCGSSRSTISIGSVNGQLDVLACGRQKSSLVAISKSSR